MNRTAKSWLFATAVVLVPAIVQPLGDGWVRIIDVALLYALLAMGLNVVVGYAGLLDLGYIAFYAVGAYSFALLASPQLSETFPVLLSVFPGGLHVSFWLALLIGAFLAAMAGLLLGAPVLRVRGDYLAIVTLGFGEIIRVFINNLDQPINITNGPKGITPIDSINLFGLDLGNDLVIQGVRVSSVSLHYYLFLAVAALSFVVCVRIERSRIGRAWMAMRDDEIAAKAMGINTRNLKLLAFSIGATFGGMAGVLFAAFQGAVSPESFSLQESVLIVAMVVMGGVGHIRGVMLGALVLASLPEALRYVADPL